MSSLNVATATPTPAQNKPLFVERYRPMVALAYAATAAAAAATLAGPTEAIRIVGMTVLTGVAYATANDMIACRDCPEYFTVGHFDDGQSLEHRLIRTLDPTANALVWGPVASWHVSAIAGAVLATAARLPVLSSVIGATSLAPFLIAGAAGTFAIAHMAARRAQTQEAGCYTVLGSRINHYFGVREKYQSGWHACNTRNTTGYAAIGLGGAALAAGVALTRIAQSIF